MFNSIQFKFNSNIARDYPLIGSGYPRKYSATIVLEKVS